MNGEGSFNFYVINEDNHSLRISQLYSPTFEGEINTLLVSDASIKRLYVDEGKLIIKQAVPYITSITIEEQTILSPVRFVQSCDAFIDGDYAIVTVSDGANEIGSFTYDFDQNINPESITLEGEINTETLVFTLTIYNAEATVIHTTTLQQIVPVE